MIRIDIPDAERVINEMTACIRHIPDGCAQAAARAINRTLRSMKAEAIRIARDAYTCRVPVGRAFSHLYFKTANKANMRGTLFISGERGMSLYNFKPNPKKPGTRPPGGVTAQVRRDGNRRAYGYPGYSKPFIMKKAQGNHGVFVRKSGGRPRNWKDYEMLYGASPIQALESRDNQERIRAHAAETFSKRLQHEVYALLAGLAGGNRR
ncbi:MAG: hypothetical protein K2O70_02995 [Desulfovibrionaceae bacterium]|nr:hypothetical protein [Desulfovibrionaceae bacterium]